MYCSLSVSATLRRTGEGRGGALSENPCPAPNCWEPVWWFPQSLALGFLLIVGSFSASENHCFSEPLLAMYVIVLLAKVDC